MRQHILILFVGLCTTGMILALGLWPLRPDTKRQGPRTLEEAMAAADKLGLYRLADETEGALNRRLVVSESPLTRERAAQLRLNDFRGHRWIGTATIYTGWESMMPNFDPACSAVWGNLFIYGDPDVIRRLTGLGVGQAF
jgi:hypothetical protein